jgi:hypothetical protein
LEIRFDSLYEASLAKSDCNLGMNELTRTLLLSMTKILYGSEEHICKWSDFKSGTEEGIVDLNVAKRAP